MVYKQQTTTNNNKQTTNLALTMAFKERSAAEVLGWAVGNMDRVMKLFPPISVGHLIFLVQMDGYETKF